MENHLKSIKWGSVLAWGSLFVLPLAAHVGQMAREKGFSVGIATLLSVVAFVEAIKAAGRWVKRELG